MGLLLTVCNRRRRMAGTHPHRASGSLAVMRGQVGRPKGTIAKRSGSLEAQEASQECTARLSKNAVFRRGLAGLPTLRTQSAAHPAGIGFRKPNACRAT